MPTLDELFESIRNWEQPADSHNPFKLACRVEPGATLDEIDAAVPGASPEASLTELWLTTREAWLFEDVEYGQWGLHLLSPMDCVGRSARERAARPDDIRADDAVLGEFLGDSELLVYSPSESGARRFLVALPLDPRGDWYPAGATAGEVFTRYLESAGEKYWEQQGQS